MKIGLITSDDYANFQYDIYKSLQAVGADVIAYKLARHIFSYENQCEVILPNQITEKYKDCDVVILIHSCWQLLEFLQDKLVIPFHTGTPYRSNPSMVNSKFNAPFILIALPEFKTLAPNPKYLVGAVELDLPVKPVGERLAIGHFPSNPSVKGTQDINRIIWQLKDSYDFEYLHSADRVSHAENLARMNACDIYVELMAPTQGGKPYGSFGISGLEAGALGKVVVTQSLSNDLYYETYNQLFFSNIRGERDLKGLLEWFLTNPDKVIEIQATTKELVKRNHSYVATGTKLMQYLNEL